MFNDRSLVVEFITKVFIAFLSNAIARVHRDVRFDPELCQDRPNDGSIESRISIEENAVNINISFEEQGDDFAEYGIGAYFALMNAMKAFRPDANLLLKAPMSPERLLTELYESVVTETM